ncbi:hypothetical protein PVK06_035314 [Gossypium arboreum]|uniref:Uncharacterized protein n=1 Tax=Gossypium arboreum TaxID=29729 RepID=A0ABR0NGH4_GOSAR|nr:hypothetical protein PVK06_035314 [Gossypium arboreum]
MEKGFFFQDAPFMGYSKAISSFVEKHEWQIFCLHPDDILPKRSLPLCIKELQYLKLFVAHYDTMSKSKGYNSEDDNEDGEEATAEKKKKEEEEEKIKSVHIESDKDEAGMTQTSTLATTATTLKSTAPMTEQECAIHQLINDLTNLDTDDEEKVPINN